MRIVRLLSLTFLVICTVVFAREASAQAWGQPPGAYFLKFSGNYLFTREEFSVTGDKQPIAADDVRISDAWFRDVSFYGYVEYGLHERATVVSSLPLKLLTSEFTQDPGGGLPTRRVRVSNSGAGDWWTWLRTPVVTRPLAVAFQSGIKIPLYSQPPNEGFLSVPPLGTGSVDAEVGVYLGLSLYPLSGYTSGGVAYRVRGGDVHDEIPFNIEAGYTFGPLFTKVRLDGVYNTEGVGGSVIAGDENYVKLSPTVAYSFSKHFVLGFEAFHVLAGKNTIAGTAYSLGLVWLGGP